MISDTHFGGKALNRIIQGLSANKFSACCARCARPMGEERMKIGRFTYGECCMMKAQDEPYAPKA